MQLTSELLLAAYMHGFFPMPHPETEEICWLNPDPRAIIPLDGFHCSRSLLRTLRHVPFEIAINSDFAGVLEGCADRSETWLNAEMKAMYTKLHLEGHAHSFEVWLEGKLVGGTYGLAIGGVFFAESKFHRVTDASKVAIFYLTEHLRDRGFLLLEVQFLTPHLKTLGAIEIPSSRYIETLKQAVLRPTRFTPLRIKPVWQNKATP